MASGEGCGKLSITSGESSTCNPLSWFSRNPCSKFDVEPVGVVHEFVETVLMALEAEVQGHVAQRGMLVDQQAFLLCAAGPGSVPDATPAT